MPLAACGGGSGTKTAAEPSPTQGEQAQLLTGARPAPATDTPAARAARGNRILSRADSLVLSTVYGTTTHASLPTFTLRALCANVECTLRELRSGVSATITLNDLESVTGSTTVFRLSKHGVNLTRVRATDTEAYGAWMEHAGFAVQIETDSETINGQNINIRFRYGMAGGDLTGSQSTVSATWQGLT